MRRLAAFVTSLKLHSGCHLQHSTTSSLGYFWDELLFNLSVDAREIWSEKRTRADGAPNPIEPLESSIVGQRTSDPLIRST